MSQNNGGNHAILMLLGDFWPGFPNGTTIELTKDQVEILELNIRKGENDFSDLAKILTERHGKQYTGPTLEHAIEEMKSYFNARAELYLKVPRSQSCFAWACSNPDDEHPRVRTLTYDPQIVVEKEANTFVRVLCNGYHRPPWDLWELESQTLAVWTTAQETSMPSSGATTVMQQCIPRETDSPTPICLTGANRDGSCSGQVKEALALTQNPLVSSTVESLSAGLPTGIEYQGSPSSPATEKIASDHPLCLPSAPNSSPSVEPDLEALPSAAQNDKNKARTCEKKAADKLAPSKGKAARPLIIVMAQWWPSLPLGFEIRLSKEEVEVAKTKPEGDGTNAWAEAAKDLTWALDKIWTARDAERVAYQIRNHILNKRHGAAPLEHLCKAWENIHHLPTEQHPWTRILEQIPEANSQKRSDVMFRAVCDGKHGDSVPKRKELPKRSYDTQDSAGGHDALDQHKRQKIVKGEECRPTGSDSQQQNNGKQTQKPARKEIKVSNARRRFDPAMVPWLRSSASKKAPAQPPVLPHPITRRVDPVQLDLSAQPSANPELPSPATPDLGFERSGDGVTTIVEDEQIEGRASAIADGDAQLNNQDLTQDVPEQAIAITDLAPNPSPALLSHSQVLPQSFCQSRLNLEDLIRRRDVLIKEMRTLALHADDKDYNARGAKAAYFKQSGFLKQFRPQFEQGAQGMLVEFDDDTRKAIEEAEKNRRNLWIMVCGCETDSIDLKQRIHTKKEELLALEEQIESKAGLQKWCAERLANMDESVIEEDSSEGEEIQLNFSLSPISPSPASPTPAS